MRYNLHSKRYDTATSKELLSIERNNDNPEKHEKETLYAKTNGEYFLFCEGGKESKYSEYSKGKLMEGIRFIVWEDNNKSEATKWVSKNVPDKFYEFMELTFVPEEKSIKTVITLTERTKNILKNYAKKNGKNVSKVIREWAETLE